MKRYDRQSTRQYHTGSKTWRAIRKAQLDREPLCRMCQAASRVTAASEVDHVDGDSWHNPADGSNYQSLCHDCHSRKSFAEAHGREVRPRGCDERGNPSDPRHYWNR